MTPLSEYFRMDRAPAKKRKFRESAEATGDAIIVEIRPNPRDYSYALAHTRYAGSLEFKSPDLFSG